DQLLEPAAVPPLREDLVPARQNAGVPVRLLVDDAAGDDGAAVLERRAQAPELLRRQPELELQVLDLRRPGLGQGPQQRVAGARSQLAAAERVEQARRLVGHEQALAAVHGERGVAAGAQLAEP